MNMEEETKDPELVFLEEAISLIKVINARTAMLIAEYEALKKAMGQTDDLPLRGRA
jgi:hypothetical protein